MGTPTGESGVAAAKKPTIHILGGGPSGLSAAFHLTSPQYNPDWKKRYDVVVHQLGWRLGGKGATGRNAEVADRVEEHGIHLFGNMYANSLHMLYAALLELGRQPGDMETEFEGSDFQLIHDFFAGRWHGFEGWLPYDDDKPWLVPSDEGTLEDIVEGAYNTISGILGATLLPPADSISARTRTTPASSGQKPHTSFSGVLTAVWSRIEGAAATVTDEIRTHATSWLASLDQAIHDVLASGATTLKAELESHLATTAATAWMALLEKVLAELEGLIETGRKDLPRGSDQLDLWYWQFVQIDLVTACLRGTLADGVLTNGIDSIDDVPYRDWLIRNQLHPLTQSSSLLQAIPNTCMQYPNGDTTGFPQMSAAAYLTFVLRQVMAPGQSAYFFRVSTGETVILPLYQVLAARGVRFEFFTKVTNLVPDATGTRIARIECRRQATVKGPPGTQYQPLRTLPNGQPVWPNAPLYAQLVEGQRLQQNRVDLESWWADWPGQPADIDVGAGDMVIVALPPAAQAIVAAAAAGAAKDPRKRWQGMLENVRTCATQALQIWLDKPTTDLGWPDLAASDPRRSHTNRWLGPTFANPLSAFADFSRTLAAENWGSGAPRGLIYFCGPLQDPATIPGFDDHDYPGREKARVGAGVVQFLRELGSLLPNASDAATHGAVSEPNSLDFGLLHCHRDDATTHGENRVQHQYFRANIDPNERYTISLPGTLKFRPSPWQSGYANVALSSDAVFTGFNIGSFEGAVMAGMLAAYAVTGSPSTAQVYGYDFCRPNPPVNDAPMLVR